MLAWFARPRVLSWLAAASVVANVGLVVTGGAVRLTASGLGCPTWPSCADGSFSPPPGASYHGQIENWNRRLIGVLTVIAIATLVAALVQRRQRGLAAAALAIVPAQAVVGGISVLTDLNPWIVGLHFLLSMLIIAVTLLLWWRVRDDPVPAPPGRVPAAAVWLTRLLVAVTGGVLVLGTIVTGSGPHAGDRNSSGRVHRTGLDVGAMAQLHADAVMVLIGLTIGAVALLAALPMGRAARRAGWTLLAVEAAQGLVGYVQYFTNVPAVLVGVHMLGASLVWIAVLRLMLVVDPVLGRRAPSSDLAPAAGVIRPRAIPAAGAHRD